MKQQVVYIHGGESFLDQEDFLERLRTMPLWHLATENSFSSKKWTSTLAEDLGDDYEVIMPPMPNKQNAKYKEWSIWFQRHFEYLRDGSVLCGCSLGAMFLAKYLTENDLPFTPKAIILMAGVYKLAGFDDKGCGDFLVTLEEIAKIGKKYPNILILHSKDDPVAPFSHGQALSQALPEAEFITFEDKNHFLIEEFPEFIKLLKI